MNFTTAVASILLSLTVGLCGSATLSAAQLNPGDVVFVQQNIGRVSYLATGTSNIVSNLSAPLTLEPLDFSSSLSLPSPQTITQGGLLNNPMHVIFDSAGRILTAERIGGTPGIVRVDPVTGSQTLVASGSLLTRPVALAFETANNLVVAVHNGSLDKKLVRVNATTGAQSLIGSLNLIAPQDVDVQSNGQIVALDFGNFNAGGGKIVRIDPATGVATTISSGGLLYNPGDLVIQPSGNYLVSNRLNNSNTNGSQILEIDAVTGAQRLVTTVPREGWIALENAGSLIYADFTLNNPITRVDLLTGDKVAISTAFALSSYNITGVAVVPVAIPEPSSIIGGVLAGLAMLGVLRRQRTTRSAP